MAEKGVGEHMVVQAGDVDWNKGPFAVAQSVHGSRHQLLAHSRLSGDQDRPGAGRHGLDILKDGSHGGADGDDLRKGLGTTQPVGQDARLEQLVLTVQLTQLDASLHAADQAAFFDRFDDIVEGTLFHALDGGFHVVRPRDDDDGHIGVVDRDLPQQLFSRQVRHPQIEEHDLDLLTREDGHDLAAVLTTDEVVHAGGAQRQLEAGQGLGLIVDHHDRQFGVDRFFHGKRPFNRQRLAGTAE